MANKPFTDPGDIYSIMKRIEPDVDDPWVSAHAAGINPGPGDIWFTGDRNHSKICQLVDFDAHQIVGGVANGTWLLIVEGEKPNQLVDVVLRPMTYVVRPEYWEIEVLGCLAPEASDLKKRYEAKLDLTAYLGTRGIALVGRTVAEKIDWPSG